MADPDFLQSFVLPVPTRQSERRGAVDLYLPDAGSPQPAVVFVPGGPLPADLRPTPRDWPVYRAYGSLIAGYGSVGATVDHRLHEPGDYPRAADDVAAAVDLVRNDPRVDADRVALWFFSGGGLLMSDWLREPPSWLRCVAASYPMLVPLPGMAVDERYRPVKAIGDAGTLPLVLTRVGRERPELAAGVTEFVAAARSCGARLEIIDVPDGRHAFDFLDHEESSREAVRRAVASVLAALA